MIRYTVLTAAESKITRDYISLTSEIPARNVEEAGRIALRDIVGVACRNFDDHQAHDWAPQVLSVKEVRG